MTALEIILIVIIIIIICIVHFANTCRVIDTDSDFKVISITRLTSSKNEYVVESSKNGKYRLISTDDYHIDDRICLTSKKNLHY